MVFSCQRDSCAQTFVHRKHLLRHLRYHDSVNFKCELCSVIFTRKDSMLIHLKTVHSRKRKAEEVENSLKKLIQLCNTCNKAKALVSEKKYCIDCYNNGILCLSCQRCLPSQCFDKDVKCLTCTRKFNNITKMSDILDEKFIPTEEKGDWESIYLNNADIITEFLKFKLLTLGNIKFTITLNVQYFKYSNDEIIYSSPFFISKPFTLLNNNDIHLNSSPLTIFLVTFPQ